MSTSFSHEEIKTLLVDDEEVAIHRLKKLLGEYPYVNIIGEAKDGRTAVDFINSRRPDLVFLDIQMPGSNGFEVLDQLQYTPLIVFTTAYEEYAVKAFEKNSLDYLLKPVEGERLALTMKRIIQNKAGDQDLLLKIQQLIGYEKTKDRISTIPVKTGNKITLVHVADIIFLEAKEKYVTIHLKEGEKLIEYSLTWLEQRLPEEFLRVHRGFIVNKLKIREIHKYFKGTFLLMMDDIKSSKIKTAYSYSETIRAKLLLP
jgi:two-component system LytT family response regulator